MHSDFSSSRLVRLIGAWVSVPPSGMDFAERLGLWVSAFDAIRLQAALPAARAPQPAAPSTPARRTAALRAAALELQAQQQRVQAALAHAIAQDPVALAGADPAHPGLAPFQRRHAELQRHMEQMLLPLRERARQCLTEAGGRLQALATLDAAWQAMLAAREQQWLASLPALLARRFEQHRQAAQQPQLALATSGPLPVPDGLTAFADDWRQLLQAELELRLEPVAGLLAALNNEVNLSS